MSMDLMPVIASISVFWLLPLALYFRMMKKAGVTFELHAYQHDFLTAMASSSLPAVEAVTEKHGVTGAAAALQVLAEQALEDSKVRAKMYDTFQCVHCGSKNPAAWIKDRKGKKEPYTLPVTEQVSSFLATALLVPVAKLGEPPVRQVVEGPRKADPSKAARVAIDWAIQEYGALEDGKPKTKSAAKSPRAAKSPSKRR